LGGEIRAVSRIENRIAEAEKLGFKKIIVSKYAVKGIELHKYKIEVVQVTKLEEMYQLIF
jgi:DNA repair protein RadA/Sms